MPPNHRADARALSEERRAVVETSVLDKFFNTNYTASWILVRTGPMLDDSGNFKSKNASCPANHLAVASTKGPLRLSVIDSSQVPSNTIPLLGDGAMTDTLKMQVGNLDEHALLAAPFMRGPVQVMSPSLEPPSFGAGKPRNGPGGWWEVWDKKVLQDYRVFSPVHRDGVNLLMADGSVQTLYDTNKDGQLNNGFPTSSETGFADDKVEADAKVLFSKWTLRN